MCDVRLCWYCIIFEAADLPVGTITIEDTYSRFYLTHWSTSGVRDARIEPSFCGSSWKFLVLKIGIIQENELKRGTFGVLFNVNIFEDFQGLILAL